MVRNIIKIPLSSSGICTNDLMLLFIILIIGCSSPEWDSDSSDSITYAPHAEAVRIALNKVALTQSQNPSAQFGDPMDKEEGSKTYLSLQCNYANIHFLHKIISLMTSFQAQ